jgi:hypothetical protein
MTAVLILKALPAGCIALSQNQKSIADHSQSGLSMGTKAADQATRNSADGSM